MKNKQKLLLRVSLCIFLLNNFAYAQEVNWGPPDAVISTQSLSDLPKDILKQPILKEVLTNEFAFYYLDSAEFLSLKGSLKRIAFEHEMTFADEILNYVMSTPADVIFWKKENGRLDDYMLSIERTNLIDFLMMVGKISASDKQLTVFDEKTEGSEKFKIYKLKYGQHNTLYFTNLGNKLIVYTDPRMPMPTSQRLKTWLKDDLYPTAQKEKGFFSKLFGSDEDSKNKHQTYLNLNFLTFGYRKYLSHIDYMAFSFNDKAGWQTHALLSGVDANEAFNTIDIWNAVPRSPAICLALPINHQMIKDLFAKIFTDEKIDKVVSSFNKNIGLCWFADSRIYSPLYVIKTNGEVDNAFLEKAFDMSINKDALATTDTKMTKEKNNLTIVKFVSSRYGNATNKEKDKTEKGFKVKLAAREKYIIFSADGNLVDKSISVINKKSPSLLEALSNKEKVAGVIYPGMLATLVKKSIEESLKAEGDSVFKEAFTKRFFPTLNKMNSMPNLSLEWPKTKITDTKEWQELSWEKFTSK